MTDSKITDLSALTGANLATDDSFEMVDKSDTTMAATGTNKKMSADEVAIGLATTLGVVGRDKIWDTKGDLVAATGADAASKLAVGSTGQVLIPDSSQSTGLKWAYRARVLDEAHADAGSASSTAEQTLASLTLPGGIIAAGDHLRFVAFGDRLNNSGGNVDYTWKFKIGATTVISNGAVTLAAGANRTPWSVTCDVMFGSTTAERVLWQLLASSSGTTAPQTAVAQSGQRYGTASEDTASSLTVALTCQLSVSNANADVILHAATLEHIPKG